MPLLSVANLHHAYGTHVVLDNATFAIDPGEKIGLVERNGCGKSTLLKAILGELTPDSGAIQFSKNARVGYLSQDPKFDPEETLRDAAEGAFAELHQLHVDMNAVYDAMATADGDELDRLMKKQARIEAAIEAAGGYAVDHKIDAMLHGLGFRDEQFSLKVSALSGGQKGRLGLARLLLEEPDLLLLDEPTNHLDIEGRKWLEEFLADEYPGAVIVVSHDRWLLDRVVGRIIEVHLGAIREYPGNYHKYVELRRERQMTAARVFDKQMDKVRQEERFIRKYKTGQRAKQARGRETRLQRFKQDQMVERPMELDVMRLNLPKPERSGDIVLAADDIAKSYDELTLFEDLSLSVGRGDRIGIIGRNGTGKTTLIKTLLGDLDPDAGAVRLGSRLSVGYYRQTQEHLDRTLTVWQYLQSVIVSLDNEARASEQQARDLAGAFLFSGAEQDKVLGELSGGERSRAVLAGLVAGAHNLLVLDEPTNHLDIPSAERLEQALAADGAYNGTILLITHDRALLQSTCDQLLIFTGNGNVTHFHGTYRDWEERQSDFRQVTAAAANRNGKKKSTASKPKPQREKSDVSADPLRKLAMSELEERIEMLQIEIASIDEQMTDEAVYTDGERCRELQEQRHDLAEELEPLETEWARRADEA